MYKGSKLGMQLAKGVLIFWQRKQYLLEKEELKKLYAKKIEKITV